MQREIFWRELYAIHIEMSIVKEFLYTLAAVSMTRFQHFEAICRESSIELSSITCLSIFYIFLFSAIIVQK